MDAKPKTGRKPFEPTPEQRLRVQIMASCGMPQDYICTQIINRQTGNPIDRKTLRRAFKEELVQASPVANAMVAQSLFKKATGTGPQSVTAAIFWLKCRAGWKPVEGVEVTGKDGAPLPAGAAPTITREELVDLATKIAREI